MSVPYAKVIVNPVAGANATRRRWPRISRLLKKVGLSFDYQYTEGVGHAIEIAREAVGNGYRYLVAVGGDGTANEVANGIIDTAGDGTIALGVVSTGTGSDFARSLGIPRHYVDACSSLANCSTALIDVGVVDCHRNGQPLRRFFINSAGIGFDAAAVQTTERLPKYFGGTIPYLIGLLRTLAGYRNQSVVLTVGDEVEAVDIQGQVLTSCVVEKVTRRKAYDRTLLVTLRVPRELATTVASFKRKEAVPFEPNPEVWQTKIDDETIVCRCERVTAGEIRRLIRDGVRDMNQLKVLRCGMGACGGKTCEPLIFSLYKREGIDIQEVIPYTKRPLLVEIPLKILAGMKEE